MDRLQYFVQLHCVHCIGTLVSCGCVPESLDVGTDCWFLRKTEATWDQAYLACQYCADSLANIKDQVSFYM